MKLTQNTHTQLRVFLVGLFDCFPSTARGGEAASGGPQCTSKRVEMSLQLKVVSINVILPDLMRALEVAKIKIWKILLGTWQKIEPQN